ncbi:DNA/RNA non-specific endonuclease [Lentzea sp. NBC_00516]|uniref:LamG-like jellyroll fold domain-containing protein n=1 Tax=Lentzea sp. NBC_00516 TaxID=2903582 RepID=UPI002E81A69D|nr:LamG-like jellyroll fold domain-containing protein [Lentzea sp. NBC_00516]WUD28439.1 DNA/RNA non-specific endonuclease [Lentzea sp. NBC_00516]
MHAERRSVVVARRWLAAVVVLALTASGLSASVPAGVSTGALPPGAATTAPGQASGTADGVAHEVPSTRSTAAGPKREQPQPPGAVPDAAAVHKADPHPDVAAPQQVTPGLERKPDAPAVHPAAVERPGDRTETTQTFDNPDGTRTLRLHTAPNNVRQPDGSWQPIDLALTERGGRWEPKVAGVRTGFALTSKGNVATVAFDEKHRVEFSLDGAAEVRGQADGASILYPQVHRGVGLRFTAQRTGLKEELVLDGPDVPATYTFTLRLNGLEPRLTDEGDIELTDGDEVVGIVPAGFMQDAAGVRSTAVRYSLSKEDTWRLKVDLDQAWLRDKARAYPVVVDPSALSPKADTDDLDVQKGRATTSTAEQLRTGYVDGGLARSYLHFTDALGKLRNQYVLGAKLNVYNVESTTCSPRSVSVHEVTGAWNRSLAWPGAAVGQVISSATFAHGGNCGGSKWAGFELDRELMSRWTHGQALPHGLALRATDEADRNGKRFGSADSGFAPYLDVLYAPEGVGFEVTSMTLPTAATAGKIVAKVTNLGATTWTPSNGFDFGYIVLQGSTKVRTARGWKATVAPMQTHTFEVPIDPLTPGEYRIFLTMFNPQGNDFFVAYQVPYGEFDLKVNNLAPTSNLQQPASGQVVETLTPTLYAEGTDPDGWPGKELTYRFRVCSDPDLTRDCQESGWTSRSWTPPGLFWGRTYFWGVKVFDTVNETPFWVTVKDGVRLTFATRVHQPEITSHLAGSPGSTEGPGLDPQIGNYSTVATDASVSTVGPDLTVTRTYNSLDPRRDTAFGTGWSSRLDMRIRHDLDESGNEVLTFPTGRQVRFGRNPDGGYASPFGQNADLVYRTDLGTYTLRDVSGSRWTFDNIGRLVTITDPAGLTETLTYDTADRVTTITNDTSKRSLRLTWQGARVTSVTAGGDLTWTYTYDGERLTKACAPGAAPNCTTYGYQQGSHYRSTVLDNGPRAYWRLGETGGDTFGNAVARRDGVDAGKQHGVLLGGAGALGGTADKAATFDGNSSYVTLPDQLTTATMSLAVEMWFKTDGNGTLLSYADQSFPTGAAKSTPILYVGTDGLLYGGFSLRGDEGPRQIVSTGQVDDGRWHHVVLSAAIDRQNLYLDGVRVGQELRGFVDHRQQGRLTLGAGNAKNWPATNGGDFHFSGAIDEVALYQNTLGALAVDTHFRAGAPVDQLTEIKLPQDDRKFATLTYDDIFDRVRTLNDRLGRVWTLDTPVLRDSVRTATLRGPAGHGDWTYTFDADNGGRLTSRLHDGATVRYEYNAAGFPSAVVDDNGHRTEQTTDERGNVLSRKTCRTAGSCNTEYFTYVKSDVVLDPRRDKLESSSDARSSGPVDTRYRTSYTYDTAGRPLKVTYPIPAGHTVAPSETTTYTTGAQDAEGGGKMPAGLLLTSTGARNQVTSRSYRANGDLHELAGPTGLRARYGYDQFGRQSTVTTINSGGSSLGTTTYEYTPRSEVFRITSPGVRNEITGVTHTAVTTQRHDGNGNLLETAVSDSTGGDPTRTTKHTYDASDRLSSTEFPDGGIERHAYSDGGLAQTVTDVRGTSWTSRFDELGRELSRTASGQGVNPENPVATTMTLEARAYDPAGRLASVTDAMGRLTSYTYYDDDLLSATRQTVQGREVVLDQRAYDPAGQLVDQTTAGGRRTTFAYDQAGNVVSTAFDPAGLNRVTSDSHDLGGNVIRTERRGAADPQRVETTTFGYDAAGLVVREDAFLDASTTVSTTIDRDERGLPRSTTDRRGVTTRYEYDLTGELVRTTNSATDVWAGGVRTAGFTRTEVLGHNTFGEVTHARDGAGNVTTTARDAMGRAVAGTAPDYTPPGGQPIKGAATRTEYDHAGNPTRTTDALQRVTSRTFDPYGRVRTVTLPQVGDQPSVLSSRYDKNGELVSQTDASGAQTLFTYDELGRRITSTQADRTPGGILYYTTRTGYDDAGNPVSVETPQGFTSTSAFNAAGELTSSTDATARSTGYGYDIAGRQNSVTGLDGVVSTTSHDLLGRAVRTAQSVGGQEKRASLTDYDANGNVIATTSAEGRRVTFGYDALNRVVKQTERVSDSEQIVTATDYDKLGNRSRFVDGRNNVTTYTSTSWGLPESIVEPGGATWTTSYDAAGQAVRLSKPGGVQVTRAFDAQGRVSAENGSGAESATTARTFGYDAAGRLAAAGDDLFRYDDRGNLLTSRGPGGSTTFTYNGDGTVATRTDASGTASYSYDKAGRITEVVDGLTGRTADYGYDKAGRPASVADRSLGGRTVRRLAYDELGRLVSDQVQQTVDTGVPPRVLIGSTYGYDRDDQVTAKGANSYGYDGAGRLMSWKDPAGKTTSYGWDRSGNRVAVGDRTFAFDAQNRLTSGDGATYTYTDRGTLSSRTQGGTTNTSSFDAFDRMTAMGAARYTYDSLDRVASRNGTDFQYQGTTNEAVTDGTRTISRLPDGSAFADKGSGQARMLFADSHGDVLGRYLSNTVDGQRSFDPFGAVTSSSGDTSAIGYQGDWTDPGTGAVNMSARWYTPDTGRFASRDDWTLDPSPSAAANRYAYGNSSPLSGTDPTGHDIYQCLWNVGRDVKTPLDAIWQPIKHTLFDSACAGQIAVADCKYGRCMKQDPGDLRMGNCKYNIGGCAARRTYTPPPPPPPSCGKGKKCTSGKPTTGPGGRKPKPIYKPVPPPPPLWWRELHKPNFQPQPGHTVVAPPSTYDPTNPLTIIIDLADVLIDTATSITETVFDAVDTVGTIADDRRFPVVGKGGALRQPEEQGCLDGDPTMITDVAINDDMEEFTSPEHGTAERATAGQVCLTTKNKKDRPKVGDPVGREFGMHRGHLVGHQFHGSHKVENVVPQYAMSNSPVMRDVENDIARAIGQNGQRVFYRVVAEYDSEKAAIPSSIKLYAVGDKGFVCVKVIPNTPDYTKEKWDRDAPRPRCLNPVGPNGG